MCRPTGGVAAPSATAAAAAATAAAAAAAAAAVASLGRPRQTQTVPAGRPTPAPYGRAVTPETCNTDVSDDDGEDVEDALSKESNGQLLDKVNKDLKTIMKAVTGPTSKLNKDATNTISCSVQSVLAVVATLSLRLSEQEVALSEAKLQAAKLELQLVKVKSAPQPLGPSATAATVSYASALRFSKTANPVPIPAAQGPVLAFYPAPEHAAAFKSAEDTKAELKKAIRPQEMQVQVDRVRKVGNAGVVVQTTSEASAAKLKQATPATLRVTEPKRRSPLVSLRHIDGEGDLSQVYGALHEQNFRESEWTLERLKAQSKLAFKKRGRGTTTVVLECSPRLREALLAKERVYIGWQVIEVVDFLSVTCCRKCHQYGHPEKYCRASEVFCGRCGVSGHRRESCTSATESCATCKRFGKPEAASHTTGAAACPARQYAEGRALTNINYGQ